MASSGKKYEIDMCHGPLFSKIVLFTLPLMATYILQLVFNAADMVVIGNFVRPEAMAAKAMAAIGATLTLNNLVISVFIGLSVGTNVVVAHLFGARDFTAAKKAVHTSMGLAFFGGLLAMAVGFLAAKPMLVLMRTPEEILPLSCTYVWICFGAIPFIMLYNFGCAVLRAVGDTRRPLIFLIIAGVVNVLLNLFFVIICHMNVAGVALATAISQIIAAMLIVMTLLTAKTSYAMRFKEFSLDWKIFREILRIGVPAGLQGSCFSLSNIIVQSSINSFGTMAIAGTMASSALDGMVNVGSAALHQTTISFVAQNLGARKYKRIMKSLYWCFFCGFALPTAMGLLCVLFARPILSMVNPNPEVINWGVLRMKVMFTTFGLCGLMNIASGGLRGLGYSLTSTISVLLGACVFRIWWVWAVFPHYKTMENLLLSYPVSWLLVAVVSSLLLFYVYRRLLFTHCHIAAPLLGMNPGPTSGFRFTGGPK